MTTVKKSYYFYVTKSIHLIQHLPTTRRAYVQASDKFVQASDKYVQASDKYVKASDK